MWDCLADHSIGSAAHISASEIGRLLDMTHGLVQSHLRLIKNVHPGVCQKLSCMTSVYRLRTGNGKVRWVDYEKQHRAAKEFAARAAKEKADGFYY